MEQYEVNEKPGGAVGMRRRFVRAALAMCLAFAALSPLGAQHHVAVPVDQDVYEILESARLRGLCSQLPAARPYSRDRMAGLIDEVLSSEPKKNGLSRTERERLEQVRSGLFPKKKGFDVQHGTWYISTSEDRFLLSAQAGIGLLAGASGGLWHNNSNSLAFDIFADAYVNGDIGNNISYDVELLGNITRNPLTLRGTGNEKSYYYVTNNGSKPYEHDASTDHSEPPKPVRIRSYDLLSYLPFSYKKFWDGSIYMADSMDANGLSGWPDGTGFGFGMFAEISASFLEDHIFVRAGRLNREWAAMEKGASLVLNEQARPFLAVESTVQVFKWLRFSFLTGILEAPNSEYLFENGENDENTQHTYQNAYSIDMVDIDFKYFHLDFGTSVIWPKRFELGYMFPLFNKVFYQNNIGDYDNLNMFINLKGRWPGVGELWFSFFLDEVNGMSRTNGILSGLNVFTYDRDMFALQVGTRVNVPWVPFGSLSVRYTKIEPYCYTHHQIKNTPWYYNEYISEAYNNNGSCLGYYLPPNSDELRVAFETKPTAWINAALSYQFIRHGADHGERQVDGSSIYSELNPKGRDSLRSWFLQDGAYQWYHIVALSGSINLRKNRVPLTVYGTLGFVYTWYTDSDGALGEKGSFSKITSDNPLYDEYPTQYGAVIGAGVRLFF